MELIDKNFMDVDTSLKLWQLTNKYFKSKVEVNDYLNNLKIYTNIENECINIITSYHKFDTFDNDDDFFVKFNEFNKKFNLCANNFENTKYHVEYDTNFCMNSNNKKSVELFTEKLATSNFCVNKLRYLRRKITDVFNNFTPDESTWDFTKCEIYLCEGLELMYKFPICFFSDFEDFFDCITIMNHQTINIKGNLYDKKNIIVHIINKIMIVFDIKNLHENLNRYMLPCIGCISNIAEYIILLLIELLNLDDTESMIFREKNYTQNEIKKILNNNYKILANRIYIVKGTDDNRNAFYWCLITKSVSLFNKCTKADQIHLEKHGFVFCSGYGNEPSKLYQKNLNNDFDIF